VKARPFVFGFTLLCGIGAAAARAEDAGVEFFEKKIRPVLVESCYECHGEKKQKGGLRLDSKAGWEKGGDTGPAIVPGNLDKSLLIEAIHYQDKDMQMPPEKSGGKLPPEQIAELEQWVKLGAPDPRTGAAPAVNPAAAMAKAREHWAFQPVTKPALPTVKQNGWVRTPVDAFVLARLEAKGMKPAAPADKRTLLRRVYFDLTGLPPTVEETEAFLRDPSPDAFGTVVDRLLDSPHYGERWGRYWLDIARYADTRGYTAGGEERRFPFSHTYRDYVIHAFVGDKPYNEFLREQIAADRFTTGEDQSALAALGFLTLGRKGPPQDMIDDRIDVVTRGLMALTVSCARCHDHKFDPIPTADYYSLYGVFASCQEPEERPLLAKLKTGPEYDDFLKQRTELEAQITAKENETIRDFLTKERRKTGDYLLAAQAAKRAGNAAKLDTLAGERKLATPILERWLPFLEDHSKQPDPIFAPWFAFATLPEKDFAPRAKELAARFAANDDPAKPLNPAVAKAFAGAAPAALKDVAGIYNALCGKVADTWTAALDNAQKASQPVPTALLDAGLEEIRLLLYAADAPPNLPREASEKILRRELSTRTVPFRKKIAALDWTHPGAPQRAMALVDKPQPVNPRVFIRGSPGNPGPPVPRRFLEVLSGPERKPFTQGSGRVELADAIASRDNPLTARVFVNRVWGWHLGYALVRTPGDFGVRTEAPVQLALLDWLSATFMEEGWSLKKLHRLILLSNTYQQASDADPRYATLDPENQLVHKFNRRRLDFEAMRDTLLATAGRLDLTVGGLPVDITTEPFARRRTVYGFIDRLNLPSLFRTFDFANPDISSPLRFTTTVPQQALFMMNSPFVIEQARELIRRPELQHCATDAEKLQALYRLLYQRAPEADELKEAEAFLKRQQARAAQPALEPGWHYGYGWFDPLVNHTKDYRALAHPDKTRWSPSSTYPDPQFGHLAITATGGHPGTTPQLSTVLRWVSPADGHIRIEGSLAHANKGGDGVCGRIVKARGGKLGEWIVFNSKAATTLSDVEVQMGEAVDFVVDCQANNTSDGYTWAPKVTFTGNYDAKLGKRSWDAQQDFLAARKLAPLSAWDKLAQAMLVGNELMFVD
jgi:hypothetical protein